MIELKNVSKSYGKNQVLSDISFTVNPGEFVCITGPSGAGKTTLLHLLTGAVGITSGTILIDGVDLKTIPVGALQVFRQRVGIMFQDYKLLKNRTVEENIAFPLEVCGVRDAEIAKRVKTVLTLVALTRKAKSIPASLSGGEKARTAIGRAVVHDPKIILADEPTGNIDPVQTKKVLELLKEIHGSGTTIILATHDTALVDELHTRVIELSEGKITRDSVGKYEAVEAEETGESKGKKDDEDKKKIKVTAVNS